MTVRDFMNYLVYIEHSAENLQFFLWYKDYIQRFNTADTSDINLAPEWTQAMEDETVAKIRREHAEKLRPELPIASELFKGTDFEKHGIDAGNGSNPFVTPPRTPHVASDKDSICTDNAVPPSITSTTKTQAADAFHAAGVKAPCKYYKMSCHLPEGQNLTNSPCPLVTIQPFREEINRIISTYIMDGSPRQLNLSAWEQKAAVQALSYTTHPTALRLLINTVETSLRRQAHPNFVRWSICNGNPARVFFARALGVSLILIGIVAGILLTLGGASRGYRAITAVAFVLGISTLVAAYKGMCVVLHGMHHRHVRPWELFVREDNESDYGVSKTSFQSFGSSNSYEDEPWVIKYEKRNVVRKVFDREVWIKEPALRQIQDTIFIQAILASLLLGGILTAIFVAVPTAHYF